MSARVTISDIAKAAGVAPSTVSYTLSGKRQISPETRSLVLNKIGEMGYKTDAVARSFSTRKTYTIGLYVKKDISSHDIFLFEIIRGINSIINSYGYKILILNEIDVRATDTFRIPYNRTFPIDGAIVTSTQTSVFYLDELDKEKIPYVLLGKPPKGKDVYYIDNNNSDSVYRAVDYFFKLGKKRVAQVMGPSTGTTFQMDCICGYKQAHEEYAIPYDVKLMITVPDHPTKGISILNERLKEVKADSVLLTDISVPIMRSYLFAWQKSYSMRRLPLICFSMDLYKRLYEGMVADQLMCIHSNAFELGVKSAQVLMSILVGKTIKTGHVLKQPMTSYEEIP